MNSTATSSHPVMEAQSSQPICDAENAKADSIGIDCTIIIPGEASIRIAGTTVDAWEDIEDDVWLPGSKS